MLDPTVEVSDSEQLWILLTTAAPTLIDSLDPTVEVPDSKL